MTLSARSFSLVKDGNPAEHNDDNAAADVARGRFAVSDGAADSAFAGAWSRALVEQFARHADESSDRWNWLEAAQRRWREELQDVDIPYHAERKFEQGAFATFVGLVVLLDGGPRGEWRASAVGDSCLFHVRDDRLLRSYPLVESKQFDRFPKLVGSRSTSGEVHKRHAVDVGGTFEPGDRFWLASDALAKWFLVQCEAQSPPWRETFDITTGDDAVECFSRWSRWIAELRATRGLENDDVTLVRVDVGASGEAAFDAEAQAHSVGPAEVTSPEAPASESASSE